MSTLKGTKLTEAHKDKIRQANIGLNKGRRPWNYGVPNYARRGPNHHNWRGGTTKEREKARKSLEYKMWRRAVFERDNYTCVFCGDSKGGNLEADHILRWSDYPDQRYDVSNGRTLCNPCHRKTPSYLDSQGRNGYTVKSGFAR